MRKQQILVFDCHMSSRIPSTVSLQLSTETSLLATLKDRSKEQHRHQPFQSRIDGVLRLANLLLDAIEKRVSKLPRLVSLVSESAVCPDRSSSPPCALPGGWQSRSYSFTTSYLYKCRWSPFTPGCSSSPPLYRNIWGHVQSRRRSQSPRRL